MTNKIKEDYRRYLETMAINSTNTEIIVNSPLNTIVFKPTPRIDLNQKPLEFSKKETNKMKLYTWAENEEKLFGVCIAVDSAGRYVMEAKGSGKVVAIDPSSLEEVIPLTADVTFQSGKQHYTYIVKEGEVTPGDVLVIRRSKNETAIVNVVCVGKREGNWKKLEILTKIWDNSVDTSSDKD